jgi:hypothetical protein
MINTLLKKYKALALAEAVKMNDPSFHIAVRSTFISEKCRIYNQIVSELKELKRSIKSKQRG